VISFNNFTVLTSVQYYVDGKQARIMYAAEVYIKDESLTAPQKIGATVGLTNFYTGFIWKVEILNYVSSIVKTDFAGARQPLGLSFQLSSCPFLQTINCVSCGGTCTYGCIRLTDCSLCLDPLCQLCSDFTSCDQCISHASNLAACQCDFGYLLDAASRICNSCSPECADCNGLTSSSCLGNAQLSGNRCVCQSGYFPDPHPDQCSPCSPVCKTCFGISPVSCLSCQTTARFISNTCICSDGYFIDQGQCLLCPSTCLFCTDAFTVCFPNSHSQLNNGICLCMEGYRGNPPLCQVLTELCQV